MNVNLAALGIDRMSAEEKIALINAIEDSLVTEPGNDELTPELKALLDERLAECEANPDDFVSWDDMKDDWRKRHPAIGS